MGARASGFGNSGSSNSSISSEASGKCSTISGNMGSSKLSYVSGVSSCGISKYFEMVMVLIPTVSVGRSSVRTCREIHIPIPTCIRAEIVMDVNLTLDFCTSVVP